MKRKLHTLKDIEKINNDYIVRAGLVLQAGGFSNDESAAKRAEEIFSEGLKKLKALKLSAQDRKDIGMLYNAIEFSIKATRELQRGKGKKAEHLMTKATQYAHRYIKAINQRFGKS